MSPIVRRYLRVLFLAGLFTAAPALPGSAAVPCEFLREDGTVRDCTFTERYGQCLWTAMESYYDCRETADTLLKRFVCEAAVQVDLMACNLGALGDLTRLVSPF